MNCYDRVLFEDRFLECLLEKYHEGNHRRWVPGKGMIEWSDNPEFKGKQSA